MTHDDTKLNTVLDKIRKLRAKAEDPSTTEAESLAFAAKVAELLALHGLEEAQLKIEDQVGIVHEHHDGYHWSHNPAYRLVVWAVARLYMTKAVYRGRLAPWLIVGRPHNLVMVRDMTQYLFRTTERIGREWNKKNPDGNIGDFRRGCLARLAERLHELHQQQTASEPQWTPTGNPSNLPALYRNERQQVASYINDVLNMRLRHMGSKFRQGDASAHGRRAADDISLSRQVGGGRSHYHIRSR